MCDQIAIIPALVKNTVLRHFGGAGRLMEPSLDITGMAVVLTVINRSVTKGFQSSAFQIALKQAAQKCMAVAQVGDDVATRTVDHRPSLYLWSDLLRMRTGGALLKKAKKDRYWNVSNKAIMGQRTIAKDKLPLQKMVSATFSSSWTYVSDAQNMNPKAYSNFTSSDEPHIRRHDRRRQERTGRRLVVTDTTAIQHLYCVSEIFPILAPKFRCQTTKGTGRPLIIAPIVFSASTRGILMTCSLLFRTCARRLPFK